MLTCPVCITISNIAKYQHLMLFYCVILLLLFLIRFFDNSPVIPLADQKCAGGAGCWYCKNLCNTCLQPITAEHSFPDRHGHDKCFQLWQTPMSPVIEEAKHNSTVMLRLSAVTKLDKQFTVIIIYLCADETKQPYVLCQVRTATYQKYLDYYIDDQFNAVKPLWDECDDRTELIRICLRKVLQPAVESRYKNCNPTQLTRMLNMDVHVINSRISFRQQDHITESYIISVLRPRVSIHMCNQQNRKEVYFLTVCSESSELPPSYTSGMYGYSIWFTKFILKDPKPIHDSYLGSLIQFGRWLQEFTQYSSKRIFKKVVSVESIEVFKDYEVELIMIAEVDNDMKVIYAYQPSPSQADLIPISRGSVQPEIDEIWPLMKESKGIQSIHSLILRERYARLVHTCVCVCVCVCVFVFMPTAPRLRVTVLMQLALLLIHWGTNKQTVCTP